MDKCIHITLRVPSAKNYYGLLRLLHLKVLVSGGLDGYSPSVYKQLLNLPPSSTIFGDS